MQPVSTVPAGEGVLDLSAEYPDVPGRSEYATLFALRRHLQRTWGRTDPPAGEEWIGVAHYRRFAVTRPTGTPDDIYGVVSPAEFGRLPEDTFLPPEGSLLLPSVAQVGTLLGQYGRVHVMRDLLHFMAIAIDLGVIEERAAASLLSQGLLVAAPSIGVYPTAWYLDMLEKLERVTEAFESTVAVPRDGYQRRVVGFCCERLNSMLITSLLPGWSGGALTNPALIVSGEGVYAPNADDVPATSAA
jgi:hypothetical protein